ncbi:hypothetical protein EU538_00685, partial [Candidatus Thorarchaeota archaeon]
MPWPTWRVRNVRRRPYSGSSSSHPKKGLILSSDAGDEVDLWFFFPERTGHRMVAALILGQSSETLRPGWHPCVVDPEQLKAKAEMALEGWKEQPIVVTSIESRHVLWMRAEEDSTWLFLGVMDYGSPPSGQRLPVRWLRISHPEVQT